MTSPVTILGIESSCDDTAAAILRHENGTPDILSSIVLTQTDLHAAYGGVVPEIAARAHAEKLDICVEQALTKANITLSQVDAIAVTAGPGLIGGVLAGVMCARGIAAATGVPVIGVNHLAGHALTPRLTDNIAFPYLLLLVSGGHCQFLIVHDDTRFERLGGTIDDAPGEAFDKCARLLGLSQPGGPAIEAAAMGGDPARIPLPRPLRDRADCDMSFSGLKTALLRARDLHMTPEQTLTKQNQADIAAAFQLAVADILTQKSRVAMARYLTLAPQQPTFAVAGGVAANRMIRADLSALAASCKVGFVAPPLALCTDNAAMIAYVGLLRFLANDINPADLVARPRWPLDGQSPAMLGSGKKGAKA